MVERGEEREARHYLNTTVAKAERELNALSLQLEEAQTKVKAKTPRRRSCWASSTSSRRIARSSPARSTG